MSLLPGKVTLRVVSLSGGGGKGTSVFALSAMFASLASVAAQSASNLSAAEQKQFVDFHNKARREVGVGPVSWSETLARSAQKSANRLASIGRMEHSQFGEGLPGENLAYGFLPDFKAMDGAKMWYDEKKLFTPGTKVDKQNYQVWGHYSQMVWSTTTEIGVGVASGNGQLFVVCHYNPGGNMMGYAPYGAGAQVNPGVNPAAPSNLAPAPSRRSNLATVQPMRVQPSQPQPTAPGAAAQSGFPQGYFHMTNKFVEDQDLVLESSPLTLRKRGDYSEMLWTAIPSGDGWFLLTTAYLNQYQQVLEGGDGQHAAYMVTRDEEFGSRWKAVPVPNFDGYYYLSTRYMMAQGEGKVKVLEGNVGDAKAHASDPFKGALHMVLGRPTGTMWKFIPVK